jgi:DNA helicase-2/ATP-dependent DNA helicase PcrA
MHKALHRCQVPSAIAQRRDDFLSAEFRWLVATLRQLIRPLDRRNIAVLVQSFNRMAETNVAADQVITDAEATGHSYLATWLEAARRHNLKPSQATLLELLVPLTGDPSAAKAAIEAVLGQFTKGLGGPDADSDLAEDMSAWRELTRDIASHIGKNAPLDQFLQELQLRSKEPTPKPGTVTLMTIHGAKGREFDSVYVIGLAEDLMPSFQSRQKGDRSPEMEEERRNCFVAITRTKECLVLSRAEHYRGWKKQPSRFLVEMGLVS